MAQTNIAPSRRAVIAALAGTPMFLGTFGTAAASTGLAANLRPDTSAWDRALEEFRRVEAIHAAAYARHDEAEEAASDHIPERPGHLIDRHGLFMGMDRKQIEKALRWKGLSEPAIAAAADEMAAYQQAWDAARRRFRVQETWAEAKKTNPAFDVARDALMKVAAPTTAALLVKMEISTISLDDEHAEATLTDARRLLAGEA
ncbi:MAG: hypothetical protein M3498_04680 [Deinococcota bacterium]|nr:hypothetical protein [Deinococcota bacterium]